MFLQYSVLCGLSVTGIKSRLFLLRGQTSNETKVYFCILHVRVFAEYIEINVRQLMPTTVIQVTFFLTYGNNSRSVVKQ